MKIMYLANILVAGWVGISSLFFPKYAIRAVWEHAYGVSEIMKMTGCLWIGITLLSLFGLFRPLTFAPVFLLQLIYKGTWLLVVTLPAVQNDLPYPKGMASFFMIWVLILPFVIPWKEWFA